MLTFIEYIASFGSQFNLIGVFDLIGTLAFAISGAAVAIRKRMDVFGVIMLGVTTACGGGLIRDLIIGNTPPLMFRNPLYVIISALVALLVFILEYRKKMVPESLTGIYDQIFFWFDTLGLAAFTIDGVTVGIRAGYGDNRFLLVFLGFLTGVGGGALRDVMANQMPDIYVKHIYALASIAGGLFMVEFLRFSGSGQWAMVGGFALVLSLRALARHYNWNLPSVKSDGME